MIDHRHRSAVTAALVVLLLLPGTVLAQAGDFSRSVTVQIVNATAAGITLEYGSLEAATWAQPPVPGSIIQPGGTASFESGVTSLFQTFGGRMQLVAADGTQYTLSWNWWNPASEPDLSTTVSAGSAQVEQVSREPEAPVYMVTLGSSRP